MRIYEGSPRQDFEEVFRSIGAYLDRRGMKEILLAEAPDGFIVQGLVLVGRVSPLAAFIPSLVLLAWTVVYVLDVSRAAELAPTGPIGQVDLAQSGRGMLSLLSTGVFGMLGVALFVPVLMPSRWAGPVRDEEEEYEETVGY